MSETDQTTLVADLARVRDDDLVGEATSRRAQQLLSEIVAAPAPPPPPPRRHAAAVLPHRVVSQPAVSFAAAAAVLAVVVTTGSRGAETASAALRQAADVARAQPALVPGRGQYVYVRSEGAAVMTSVLAAAGNGDRGTPADPPKVEGSLTQNAWTVLVPRVRELWWGRSGGRLQETSGEPAFLSAGDRARWVAAGRPDLAEVARSFTAPLPPLVPLELSSDPDALYAQLEKDAAGRGNGLSSEMLTLVGDALRETNATPAQRAALYTVAARISGVDLVGDVTDQDGRAGRAVAIDDEVNKTRLTLTFDPETSALLAEEQVVLAGNAYGYPAGTRIVHATYAPPALVDSPDARP
ncbi:MAG: CU044_5270 family protein [Actinobacteria bacterium]|nr:CU044_5270 family protein [Actinomycetota bacterium]